MDLTALTLVKIDGDVIEEFVRHTLQFVDRLIVADNVSLDGTGEILGALQEEGLPLDVWSIEMVAERAGITTELARRAFAETRCDYLLLLDADEFVKAPSRALLESSLAALPTDAHALVPWETYVPTRDDDMSEPRILCRLRHRRRSESVPYSKLFVSRSFARQTRLSVAAGNHFIENGDEALRSIELQGIKLAHFPVRSLGQIQCKALLGWTQYLASGFDREGEIADHWRWLYDRLRKKTNWSFEDFLGVAWHYLDQEQLDPEVVLDPIQPVTCCYPITDPNVLDVAIAYARQLATAYAARAAPAD